MATNSFNPWTLSLGLLRTFLDFQETVWSVPRVLAARTPILVGAVRSPMRADRREIGRMVSEKVDAFGESASTLSRYGVALSAGLQGNARDLGRLAGGELLGPSDWWRIARRNLVMTSAMIRLPGAMLAPIHKGVTANARRLASDR